MLLRFWGTRGSIPTPSTEKHSTVRYGGNTSCVELLADDGTRLIFDSGTGIRNLGQCIGNDTTGTHHVLFSHVHWDHIQGFPFLTQLFHPENTVVCHGPRWESDGNGTSTIERALRGQQTAPNFPARLEEYPAAVRIESVDPGGSFDVGNLRVRTVSLNHPNGSLAYRVDDLKNGTSMVYATDTEHPESGLNDDLQALIAGADALVYDSQYTKEMYAGETDGLCRRGWGHSTPYHGIDEARAAGVKNFILFHHDPSHDDKRLDELLEKARAYAARFPDGPARIAAAMEGGEILF